MESKNLIDLQKAINKVESTKHGWTWPRFKYLLMIPDPGMVMST